MTKDEFFKKFALESSLAVLTLDEADDITSDMYELLLKYREYSELDFFNEHELTREEFLEFMDDYADVVINRMKSHKKFIKKMREQIKG